VLAAQGPQQRVQRIGKFRGVLHSG
jgi:hypothetical protein